MLGPKTFDAHGFVLQKCFNPVLTKLCQVVNLILANIVELEYFFTVHVSFARTHGFARHTFFLGPKIDLISKIIFGIQKEKAFVLSLFKVCLH